MASIEVSDGRIAVRLTAAERLLGLTPIEPEAPLSAVRSARVVRPARSAVRGVRAPGLGFPGVAWIGHWRGKGHDFVAVYGNHGGVVVELEGQRYARFVVSTDDAEDVVAEIERRRV